jgi:enterochelin esterase-like enzyme
LLQYNRDLSRELKKAGIPYVYDEFSGGHSWTYWETHLADMLRFFAAQLNETSP